MAESICRSCFHSYVCEQFNEHRDGDNDKCHFFNDHFVHTADVVEVVRCEDCAYSEKITDPLHGDKIRVCNFGLYRQAVPDMHYCSHGAKMDGKGEGE